MTLQHPHAPILQRSTPRLGGRESRGVSDSQLCLLPLHRASFPTTGLRDLQNLAFSRTPDECILLSGFQQFLKSFPRTRDFLHGSLVIPASTLGASPAVMPASGAIVRISDYSSPFVPQSVAPTKTTTQAGRGTMSNLRLLQAGGRDVGREEGTEKVPISRTSPELTCPTPVLPAATITTVYR